MRDIVVHESGLEIDLQEPNVDGEHLLRSIRDRRTKAKTRPGELRCRKHGGDLYLQVRSSMTVACHWPGTGGSPHPVALMSREHRVQVEYIARAAEREGLAADREHTLPTHVRPDLVVNGTTAFEVQRSHITITQAKARTTKAVRGGMDVSLWISDKSADAAPAWLNRIPSVRVHAAEWKQLPAVGTATVESGLSRFTRQRCYGSHDSRCITASARCTGWRLKREPMLGVTLDRLSTGLAVGEFVAAEVAGDVHVVDAVLAKDLSLVWAPPLPPAVATRDNDDAERIECQAGPPPVAASSNPVVTPSAPTLVQWRWRCCVCSFHGFSWSEDAAQASFDEHYRKRHRHAKQGAGQVTGPCGRCGQPCIRYGPHGSAWCDQCRATASRKG
jgi:hypothetical protein